MKDDALDQDSRMASLASVRGLHGRAQDTSEWLERISAHWGVSQLLRLQRELPLRLLQWDGKKGLTWLELNDWRRPRPSASGAELAKGQEHYLEILKRAERDGRFVVGDVLGLNHAFVGVPADTRARTFLCAGPFLTCELDWAGAVARWQERTDAPPSRENPDFMRFLKGALTLPVLEPPALDALDQYLTALSGLISGQSAFAQLHEQVEQLKQRTFDPLWSNDPEEAPLDPQSWKVEPEAPCREGSSRSAVAAMALMPVLPKHPSLEPAQVLVTSAQVQRACARFASRFPDARSYRLHDYGVALAISVSGKSVARSKSELRERALQLKAMIQEQFGVVTLVGVGRSVPPGESPYPSHQGALSALHACVQLDKDLLFHDELGISEEGIRYARVDRAASDLSNAFDRVALADIKSASDEYVRLLLGWSENSLQVIRGQLLSLLFGLIKGVQRRHLLRSEVAEKLAEELSQKIEDAPNVPRLLETFKETLSRLSLFASRALEGPKSMRLDTTLQYLKDNFAQQLRLTSVARKAGFSVPAFSRIFKQATGTSFLVYLRNIRVEQAKLLLRSTTLSAEQVAQACGFQSQHHLIRSFKKVTRATPGSYRKLAKATA